MSWPSPREDQVAAPLPIGGLEQVPVGVPARVDLVVRENGVPLSGGPPRPLPKRAALSSDLTIRVVERFREEIVAVVLQHGIDEHLTVVVETEVPGVAVSVYVASPRTDSIRVCRHRPSSPRELDGEVVMQIVTRVRIGD